MGGWVPDWNTAEWAQVGAAVFTAFATLAAFIAVLLSYLQQRAMLRPHLSGGVLTTRGVLSGSFANAGPGLATHVVYCVECNGVTKAGLVGSGHLGVGDKEIIGFQTFARPEDKVHLMWMCNDVHNNVYIWSNYWKFRRFSRRRWLRRKSHSAGDAFDLMFPGVRPESDPN